MNPLGIALQGIGLAAAFVALQGFGPAEEVIPPVDQQVVASGGGGSGGFAGPVAKPKKRAAPLEIPIAEHNEDDEEEIVLALLMRIAQLEYFE